MLGKRPLLPLATPFCACSLDGAHTCGGFSAYNWFLVTMEDTNRGCEIHYICLVLPLLHKRKHLYNVVLHSSTPKYWISCRSPSFNSVSAGHHHIWFISPSSACLSDTSSDCMCIKFGIVPLLKCLKLYADDEAVVYRCLYFPTKCLGKFNYWWVKRQKSNTKCNRNRNWAAWIK